MNLTERATAFLGRQEFRSDAIKSMEVIEKAFSNVGIEASQALIDFQMNYGGLTIYVGLEPICFGILHGEKVRGNFDHPEKHIRQLIHYPPEKGYNSTDHFHCADTRYQEDFTMDIDGVYYEGWQPCASSFENLVEDLAVFSDMREIEYKASTSEYFTHAQIDFEQVKQDLNLSDYPDYPQDITKWAQNQEMTLRLSKDEIRIFSSTDISEDHAHYLKEITTQRKKSNLARHPSYDYPGEEEPERNPGVWSRIKRFWS